MDAHGALPMGIHGPRQPSSGGALKRSTGGAARRAGRDETGTRPYWMSMDSHGAMPVDIHVLVRPDQYQALLEESARSGLPMAELVRRALDSVYRPYRRPSARGVEVSVGLWRRLDAGVTGRRLRRVD